MADVVYVARLLLDSRKDQTVNWADILSCAKLGVAESTVADCYAGYQTKLDAVRHSLS